MGIWIDKVKNHDIWNSLYSLGSTIDNVSNVGFTISVDNAEGIERLRQILAFTGKRLAMVDPFLLDIPILNAINTKVQELKTILDTFINEEDESRLITAQSIGDDIISSLSRVLTPSPIDDLTLINESITAYRNKITEYTQSESQTFELINLRLAEFSELLTVQEQRLSEEQNRLASLAIEQQTQFSTAQDARASEYSLAISEFNSQFSTAQLSNQSKLNELINGMEKKLNQLHSRMSNQQDQARKTYSEDLNGLHENFVNASNGMVQTINSHLEDAKNLLGIIGNVGATSGYLREANIARYAQIVWQFLTVCALGGLIWVAFLMAFPPEIGLFEQMSRDVAKGVTNKMGPFTNGLSPEFIFYQTLATRIFLSVTFGVFAAYSARQAEKYMDMDKRNRKLALELAAVGPYIAPLPVDMQNKFRAELAEKSFGVTEHLPTINQKDPVSVFDVIKSVEAEEFIARVIKRIKDSLN